MPFREIPVQAAELRVAVCDSLVVAQFLSAGTVAGLDELERVEREVIERHGRVSLMISAAPSMERISPEVRQRAAQLTTAFEGKLLGLAIVIPGSGLGAAMLRTVVMAINLLSRSTLHAKSFATASDALAFLKVAPRQTDDVRRITPADVEALVSRPLSRAA
ncbi:MAG: hypothetical protein ACOZQL_37835 [Myxococcota bacterium]